MRALLFVLGFVCIAACREAEVQRRAARDPRHVPAQPEVASSDTAGCGAAVTSIDVRTCESAEFRRTDRGLSALEDSLTSTLDSVSARQLAVSSGQWRVYRRDECGVLRSVYAGGTMGPIAVLGCLVDLTNARTSFLRNAYSAQLNSRDVGTRNDRKGGIPFRTRRSFTPGARVGTPRAATAPIYLMGSPLQRSRALRDALYPV